MFPNDHHRATEIIQWATKVLTASGTPARSIFDLLSTSSGCSENAADPVDVELIYLNTKLMFPDSSVEPIIEIEYLKPSTVFYPDVRVLLDCTQGAPQVALAGGRN